MTTTMKTTGHLRQLPPPEHAHRRWLDSFTEMPTHLITLSPAFISALRRVAPTARPRRLRYLVALAVVASIGIAYRQRILLHIPALHTAPPAPAVAAPSTAAPSAADVAGVAPSSLRHERAGTKASGTAPARPAATAPTTISVEDLPHAAPAMPSKAMKDRTLQVPR
jgi:hypothetical protein